MNEEALPLIPKKAAALCSDIRPLLRETFRELDIPPDLRVTTNLIQAEKVGKPAERNQWKYKYIKESEQIHAYEEQVKNEYARKLARCAPSNMYRLRPLDRGDEGKRSGGLLEREHLVPHVEENCAGDASLWVRNMLSSSSENVRLEVRGCGACVREGGRVNDYNSDMSFSVGGGPHPPCPLSPASPRPAPPPEHVVCVPPFIEFINFTVGHTHTQLVRVVNMSKLELRVSLRPPQRPELDVTLCGPRGLTVSAGSSMRLLVKFTPRSVRTLRDVLRVRASTGQQTYVPILCQMTPPVLEILVPVALSAWQTAYSPSSAPRAHRPPAACVLDLGAALLGDTHTVHMLLHCCTNHARFFIITEDAWQTYTVDCINSGGAVVNEDMVVFPAQWRGGSHGGGTARGSAWCRARTPGLLEADFRVICSTAICRNLTLIADALMYRPTHITLAAHEREYDVFSVSDVACEYFVEIGAGFPATEISTPIHIINHSPIPYSYYWQARAWEGCACHDLADFEPGAPPCSHCLGTQYAAVVSCHREIWADRVVVQPSRGVLAPREQMEAHVCTRTAMPYGLQSAALVLILENIPIESIPHDYDPIIVASKEITSDPIPGQKVYKRAVLSVAALQLEVRWRSLEPRLILQPRAAHLVHSKRVQSIELELVTTQLSGSTPLTPLWSVPPRVSPPSALCLIPLKHSYATVKLTLPIQGEMKDVFTVSSPGGESVSRCELTRSSLPRSPHLTPALAWLGVHFPGAEVTATFQLTNDTYEHIWWGIEVVNLLGQEPGAMQSACINKPCDRHYQPRCACEAVKPKQGELAHGETQEILYRITLPMTDGLFCSILQVRHSSKGLCAPEGCTGVAGGEAGTARRGGMVACRVLAPKLVLRAMPCGGEGEMCAQCSMDECIWRGGSGHTAGAAVLRAARALPLGRRACYQLRITNLTPLSTFLHWDDPIDGTDILKIRFIPKLTSIAGSSSINVQVVVEGIRVCARRVYVCRAQVANAHAPLYLIIEASVSGLEIECEVQLGGDEKTRSIMTMYRKQAEVFPNEPPAPTIPERIFAEYDQKRRIQNEKLCKCKFKMEYIAPEKRPVQPPDDPNDYPPPEIISQPPSLTRVCKCSSCGRPMVSSQEEPYALQFIGLPLNTVWCRRITVRNKSCLTGRWRTAVRRWPATLRNTIDGEVWSCESSVGMMARCEPSHGVLAAHEICHVNVMVRADCWGCYYEQILLQIEELSPIILDVWVDAVGPALEFLIKPNRCGDEPPVVWLTSSDPERTLRARNTSRANLTVQAFVTVHHQRPEDELPFRLYFRFLDVLPALKCPCYSSQTWCTLPSVEEESMKSLTTISEEMDTSIELYLAPDCGYEDDSDFQIEPRTQTVCPDGDVSWQVKLHGDDPPEGRDTAVLMLRVLAQENRGACWCRRDQLPQRVFLREPLSAPSGPPAPALLLSRESVYVRVCVVDLPADNVTRIRKHFKVRNTGRGRLLATLTTTAPWCVVKEAWRGPCGCVLDIGKRGDIELAMPARSCVELALELTLTPTNLSPVTTEGHNASHGQLYEPLTTLNNEMVVLDELEDVILRMPLTVDLEYPVIRVTPSPLNFGLVCDDDKREAFFTVSHSSRLSSLHLALEWSGCEEFQLQSSRLLLAPGEKENVFIHYTGRWLNSGAAEGVVTVHLISRNSALQTWCRAELRVLANPTRDRKLYY